MSDEWFPWEQLPDESGKAWEAFQVYRDLGPSRTLEKAAKTLDKHSTTLSEMGRKWNWEPRVRAWDAQVDRVRRSAYLDCQRIAVEQHLKDATELREVAKQILAQWRKIKAKDKRVVLRDALAFIRAAAAMEQTSLGLPSEAPQMIEHRSPQEIYLDNLDEAALLREMETATKVLRSELQPSPKLLEANNTTEKADHGPATGKDKNRRRRTKHGK